MNNRFYAFAAFPLSIMAATMAMAQDITSADVNRDGRITRAEFASARLANFNRLDRNGDGVVSQADIGRIARVRPRAGQALQQLVAAADANHNGQVTRDEMAKAPIPVFDRADINHDGVIDRNEMAGFRTTLAQMRGQ